MTSTQDLIAALAKDAKPVRRLRPPLLRGLCWLAVVMAVFAGVALLEGVRGDLADRLRQVRFDTAVVAAAATGVTAAIAAFFLCLPDRSRLWALLPLPAAALWLSALGYQCLTDWVTMGPQGLRLGESASCLMIVALMSLPSMLLMLAMLRYAAALRSKSAILMGSLAVAAVTAVAHELIHVHDDDATLIVLFWNLGLALVFIALGNGLSGPFFAWMRRRAS